MTASQSYKQHIAGIFSRASARYGQVGPSFFSYFGSRLVTFACITTDANVLDVACGRGAVLFPAGQAVGNQGRATGIDIAEGMVRECKAEIALKGPTNITVTQMDAELLDFPSDSFDTVLCGLGLFFLPDLARALSAIHRVLKPGGWFATSTFLEVEDPLGAQWQSLNQSFDERLSAIPEAGLNSLNTKNEMREVLFQSGFSHLEFLVDKRVFFYRNPEEWWASVWADGYRELMERMEPAVLAQYKKLAFELFARQSTSRGLADTWHLLYSKGRKL